MSVIPQSPVIDATLTILDGLSWPVGDAHAPDADPPYLVVYSLDDEAYDGPINDGQADVHHNIQVTSVGETSEQARKLADKAREALTVVAYSVAGRSVQQVELRDGGGIERDPDDSPPVFYAVDVYRVITFPA